MTIITKAALAAELNVSKSRVSQYLKAGLPERVDGKLDREAALHWVSLNLRSGHDHRKGPARARKLAPEARPPTQLLGSPEAARRALAGFAGQVLFYIAHTAVDLGISLPVVYALTAEVGSGLDDVAAEQMIRLGNHSPGRLVSGSAALAIDWATLADRAGEPLDLAAMEAFRAETHARIYGAEPDDSDDGAE